MKKVRLGLFTAIILVWIFALVAGCSGGNDNNDSGNATPTSTGSGIIRGIAYDENGLPLPGAAVSYETEISKGVYVIPVITDANGAFTLSEVPAGDCRVKVEKGDNTDYQTVDVVNGETDTIEMKVQQSGIIEGIVTNEENDMPLDNAKISITLSDGVIIDEMTNSSGYYKIEDIYEGINAVTVSKNDFVSQTTQVAVDNEKTATANFSLMNADDSNETPTPPPTYGKVYAIFIGISKYPNSSDDLNYAVADANDLAAALKDCSAWKDADITMLLDSNAEKTKIKNAIAEIVKNADKNDLFVMTYSGHGTNIDNKGAMCIWEGTKDGTVDDGEVAEWISDLKCPFLFIDDSCHSAYWTVKNQRTYTENGVQYKVRLKTDVPGYDPDFTGTFNPTTHMARGMGKIDNVFIAAAAGLKESAVENGTLKHGYFTYYILEGLGKGSTIGPADTYQDKYITAEEMFNYAKPKVVKYSDGKQNPVMLDNYPTAADPSKELILKK